MSRLLPLIAIFLGGLIAGFLLPAEWRGKLSRPLAVSIGEMVDHMPDD